MVVSLLLAVPAAVGLWLVTGGRALPVATARVATAAAAGLTLLLAVVVAVADPDVDRVWLAELGLRWSFGVDGIAVPLVLLTALVGVLVAAHAWVDVPVGGTPATFLGCLLLVEAGALATFTARDAVLFFVAFELVLVPMWVLISRYGDRHDERARVDAGHRFVLYTAFGSTLMLVGILLLVTSAGTSDLQALADGAGAALPADRQLLVAAFLVTGLAVKVPVFPLHTWLPPAHTTAPTAGSVLLAAVLLKMGTYGLVRLPVATVPDGFATLSPVLAVAGVVGIVWGALVCLVERDLKRLIAYSSVAHMGFVVLALAAGTETGLQAALFANIAHGVVSALLFVLVGGLKQRWGSVDLAVPRSRAARDLPAPRLPPRPGAGGEPRPARPRGVLGRAVRGVRRLAARARTGRAGSSSRAPSWRPSGRRSPRRTPCAWPGSSGWATAPTAAPTAPATPVGIEAGVLAVLAAGDRPARGRARPAAGDDLRRRRRDRDRAVTPAADLVSVDAVVLAPALLPALGAVLVLVVDALVPGRRALAPVLGAVVLLVGGRCGPRLRARGRRRPVAHAVPARPRRRLPVDGRADHRTAPGRHPPRDRGGARPAPRRRRRARATPTVTTALLLAAASGGAGVAASRDLGTWLVTLELATVPVVALVAMRGTRSAAHGALTLLVTSLTSFALLVLGSALWLTATGDASFAADTVATAWTDPERRAVLVLAVTVLLAGLGFKLSLVPFHAWTPQAYSTADLGTALALAAASKIAALAALLVVVQALVGAAVDAAPVTVVAGRARRGVDAARQRHGAAPGRRDPAARLVDGRAGRVGRAARRRPQRGRPAGERRLRAGLRDGHGGRVRRGRARGRRDRSPASAASCAATSSPAARSALALLVLAGLPPGIIGLVAKVVALRPAVEAGLWPLVLVAVVAVVLGIAVYLRWFALLVGEPERRRMPCRPAAAGARVVLLTGTVLLVVLSALPALLLDLLA